MYADKHDNALICRAERFAKANEARDNQTRQRAFECSFESRDLPGSRAAIVDFSDGGRAVWHLVRTIDRQEREAQRIALLNRAAAKLPRSSGLLRRLLWAIYRNGSNRRETMAELGISRLTYWRGVKFFLKRYCPQQIKGEREIGSLLP